MKQQILHIILLSLVVMLLGCHSHPTDVNQVNQTPAIWPDYTEVTIPANIAPLNFSMADDAFEIIDVTVKGSKTGSLHTNGSYADFDIDAWHRLLQSNKGGQLTFTVCAEKDGQWTQYLDFQVFVSTDEMDVWGITYRRIPPSYEIYSKMGIYQRCLSDFEETALMENSQIPGQCVNCHTANRTSPDQYVWHVRGQPGATIVSVNGNEELLEARNDSLGGSMVYPYWHPGGRYCAFSTNQTSQMFHTSGRKRIEVYDGTSDVFVYDTRTHTILKDTLTMTLLWAENTPAFSPDGKWLYFTTAQRQVYPPDFDKEKYSLCRVAFDAETGRLGQQVDTLINTVTTGKSVTWPRPSYDGRYIMYTQTDYGYFSVWHPEADLWLLDLQTGVTRSMDEVNSPRAESLHNWTPNSHWFLFTSRRDDGLYTRVYFSSLDADGKATKPFLLPQHNPKEYYRGLLHSYNTPDFASSPIVPHARELGCQIENDKRVNTRVTVIDR
jgi:Tol biopolymer transport system component